MGELNYKEVYETIKASSNQFSVSAYDKEKWISSRGSEVVAKMFDYMFDFLDNVSMRDELKVESVLSFIYELDREVNTAIKKGDYIEFDYPCLFLSTFLEVYKKTKNKDLCGKYNVSLISM